MNHKHPLLPG
jgi:hypothetical protein